jgi:hypothetical protein
MRYGYTLTAVTKERFDNVRTSSDIGIDLNAVRAAIRRLSGYCHINRRQRLKYKVCGLCVPNSNSFSHTCQCTTLHTSIGLVKLVVIVTFPAVWTKLLCVAEKENPVWFATCSPLSVADAPTTMYEVPSTRTKTVHPKTLFMSQRVGHCFEIGWEPFPPAAQAFR